MYLRFGRTFCEAKETQAKGSHIPLITPSSLKNEREVRVGDVRLHRPARALRERQGKIKLGLSPELEEERAVSLPAWAKAVIPLPSSVGWDSQAQDSAAWCLPSVCE